MNLLLSYIAGHLLSIIEQELISEAPEVVAITVKEIQLLISKLETYVASKSAPASALATPILNEVSTVATAAVSAAGAAVAQNAAA